MYGSENTLTTAKIVIGIVISLVCVMLSKMGAFQDVYKAGANLFKDFQQQNSVFFAGISQDLGFFSDLGSLNQDNLQLKAENNKLLSDNVELQKSLADAQLILKQLSFDPKRELIPVRMTLLLDDQTEIMLNKGKLDGINLNGVLISENYLLGKVIESEDNYAKAKLIFDSGIKMAVITEDSKLKGIASGDGINSLKLTEVPNNKSLQDGEYVLTAGTDGIFPYGLIVGKVVNIKTVATAISQEADIIPVLKLREIRDFFQIK
jgi:rod shape-determining protein MreC